MADHDARQAFRHALASAAAGVAVLAFVAAALVPLGAFSHLEGAISQLCVTLPHITSDVASALLVLFVGGSLVSGLFALAASTALELRLRRHARPNRGVRCEARLRSAAAQLGIDVARIRVVTESVMRCRGYARPYVELGHGVVRYLDDEQLRVVLAHEWHHAVRRDPARYIALSVLARLLVVFPIVSAARSAWKREAEFAADDAASRATSPHAVARTLLAFASIQPMRDHAMAFSSDTGIGTRAARQLGVGVPARRRRDHSAMRHTVVAGAVLASCVAAIAALPSM